MHKMRLGASATRQHTGTSDPSAAFRLGYLNSVRPKSPALGFRARGRSPLPRPALPSHQGAGLARLATFSAVRPLFVKEFLRGGKMSKAEIVREAIMRSWMVA